MVLDGKKTNITALLVFLMGLSNYVDPQAAQYISDALLGQGVEVPASLILMTCGVIFGFLSIVTKRATPEAKA